MAYNIIFYFTDQQRWDTCGCFGQPLNITPNLDQLARDLSDPCQAALLEELAQAASLQSFRLRTLLEQF